MANHPTPLSAADEQAIVEAYATIGLAKVCQKWHTSKDRVKAILAEHDVPIRGVGGRSRNSNGDLEAGPIFNWREVAVLRALKNGTPKSTISAWYHMNEAAINMVKIRWQQMGKPPI